MKARKVHEITFDLGQSRLRIAIVITLDGQVAVYERGDERGDYLPLAGPYDPPDSVIGRGLGRRPRVEGVVHIESQCVR
jgi:hypothetical protein